MQREDQVKELFYLDLEHLERLFHAKATVTVKGIWVTIQFGNLYTVTGRGYLNAIQKLDSKLDELVE